MAKKPDMPRNSALAGKTVSNNGYNVTYDENGYATKAVKYSGGGAAPSSDAVLSGGTRGTSSSSSYDNQYLSDNDLASIKWAQDEYKKASEAGDKAGMDAAHRYAESIRSQYGYSGGRDGSRYIQTGSSSSQGGGGVSGGKSGGFSYESAPQYVNRYQDKIDELTAQILGREAFSYDPEKDPTYQQYQESYTRGGQRAMQDTLAQMAARTGGLASSYADIASQQTYDNYMSALSDKIPELRQLAYSMYQDEGNTLRDNLSMLASLEQGDYAKFADQLGQFNTDRNFNYGVYRDDVGDQRYNTEWNYQVGRDQLADQRYNTEWNYQVGRDQLADQRYSDETAYNREQDAWQKANYASETEYNQALSKAQLLASYGDFSGYRALGYSDQEISNLTNAYNAAQLLARQASAGRSSGSSSGRGSGGSSGSSGSGTSQNSGIVDTMLGFENDNQAYEYLIGLGYSNAKTDTLWDMYQTSKGGGQSGAGQTGGMGQRAESLMRQLQTIPGLTEDNKVSMIEDAYNNGRITEEEANRLMDYIGR